MLALSASSAVLGASCIPGYSHGANYSSTADFHITGDERHFSFPYDVNMPRKSAKPDGARPEQPDWFLPAWMRTLKVSQAKLARDCGWAPSTMHGIYHGRTSYYREMLNLIALKLKIQPFELLMPPERAMAFRQFQASAREVATLVHDAEEAEERRKAG